MGDHIIINGMKVRAVEDPSVMYGQGERNPPSPPSGGCVIWLRSMHPNEAHSRFDIFEEDHYHRPNQINGTTPRRTSSHALFLR
jgi:hypothetical protein